ncbi:serine/threonine-protein kinase haspin homolog isoform X2 [Hydra vulgaris]|uniref:non-specific serine/threonine protein kinase n=1 Tax=Hydra vulgaris TaxID=6087 RepID=A0ABM4BVN0_HYDVU
MKKIKTYGKVKSKKYITSNDWDSLKDKAHKTEIRDLTCSTPVVVSNTPRVNDIVDDFSKLSILSNYQSTPLVPYNVDAPYEDSCSPCDICSPLLFSTYEEEEEIKRLKKYEKNAKRCLIHTILISSDSIKEDLTKENCIKKVACKEDVILCLSSTLNSSVSSFQRSVSFISSKSKPKIKKVFSAGVLSLDHNSSVVPLSPYGKFKNALSCKENDEDMLLSICEQQCLINIEEYIKSSHFLSKLGEGSFSDVYEKIDENNFRTAIKVIPFGNKDYSQISLADVLPEIEISKKLSDLEKEGVKGFLKVHKILYCKGCYPSILKDLWEKWDKDHMSENNYPNFGDNQKYIVMETNYGGVDLEHFSVTTFKQSLLILKEIITALSAAEKKLMFEHRDLHWGNVLIDNSQGLLNVSIIDFTLSRLLADECVVYTDLGKDSSLFEGDCDIQFDVYRQMKEHIGNDWKSYNPITNVFWVTYLCKKLVSKLDPSRRATLHKFITRLSSYSSCSEILQSDMLMRKS